MISASSPSDDGQATGGHSNLAQEPFVVGWPHVACRPRQEGSRARLFLERFEYPIAPRSSLKWPRRSFLKVVARTHSRHFAGASVAGALAACAPRLVTRRSTVTKSAGTRKMPRR